MAKVIVANAGTHPEPMYLAAGLLKAGHNVSYWTALSWKANSPLMRFAWSHIGRKVPLAGLVRRRSLPQSLAQAKVRRFASSRELRFQYLLRARPSKASAALMERTIRFRRDTATALEGSAGVDAIIAQQTSAHGLFMLAPPNTRKVLTYPIAHHRWMTRYLRDEAMFNPEWSRYLQGHDRNSAELDLLDQEIEMADVVVVPSTFVKDTFIQQGVSATKIVVLHLGASMSGLFGPVRPSPLPSEAFNVLFVGQITQRKGISYLLDAFRTAAVPGSVLTMVGRPIAGIESAVPRDLDIRILPPRSRDELGYLYRDADVLVLPSLAEGFPLVAIEAMSCGTPCIVSDKTFGHDVIDEGVDGFVVPARDAEALAARIRLLASDPHLLQAMSAAASAKAATFTWERYEDSVVAVSAKLLGN